jgi:hypothetical protein
MGRKEGEWKRGKRGSKRVRKERGWVKGWDRPREKKDKGRRRKVKGARRK